MQYFIKDSKVHIHPVPSNCTVKYTKENLYNEIPAMYDKCDKCFKLK